MSNHHREMTMTRIGCMALVAAATLTSGIAVAQPLRYDEAVDGDLVYLGADRTEILPLAFGNNIIRGSVRYELVGGVVEEDSDTFGFTVPIDGSIQRIRLSYGPYPYLLERVITLWDRSTGELIGYYHLAINYGAGIDTPNPDEPFADVLPTLVPGHSYSIVMSGATWQYPGGPMPYEWSFLVTGRPAAQ
jgi:hypothetical protein